MAQFDPTPSLNDEHYEGDVKWIFDGVKWVKQVPTIKTENIELTDPTHPASLLTSTQTLPDLPADTTTQLDANRYIISALEHLDDFTAGIAVGDSPPAEYKHGTLWWDSSPDKLTLYMYYDPDNDPNTAAWVEASPPTSLDGINATIADALLVQDDLVSRVGSGETIQASLQSTVTTALTTQGNIQSNLGTLDTTVSNALITQGNIQADIEELENKVTALEGTVTDAQYILSARPDNLPMGQFQIYDGTGSEVIQWDQAQSIVFNKIDNQGITHTFDTIGLEDLMRVGGVVGSAVYRVKSAKTENNQLVEFFIEHVSSSDVAVQGTIYDFEFTPGFDPSAYATKTYVDDQDALKVNKSGDTVTGILNISTQGQANDDGARLYMKDSSGNTNLTLFPSGLISAKNQIRVRRDTGDSFVVQNAAGNSTKAKWNSDGHIEAPKVKLTGGAANVNERVIDVQSGQAGRLAYNALTKLSWGASNVWIGSTTTTGEAQQSVTLNLQHNPISNVGVMTIDSGTGDSNGRYFTIKGTLEDGTDDSSDFFYAYYNTGANQPDAVNYKGRIVTDSNIVNKGYVDNLVAGIDTSGNFLPLAGGTMTGLLTISAGDSNGMVDLTKTGNNDIRYQGNWIVSFQGNDSPSIKVDAPLNMNSKKINNVADPTSDSDAVNKGYLKGARVAASYSSDTQAGGFYQSGGKLFYKTV